MSVSILTALRNTRFCLAIGIALLAAPLAAEDETTPATEERSTSDAETTDPGPTPGRPGGTQNVTTVNIIGSKEAVYDLPGSGYFLDTQDIRQHNYDDINKVLRKVPGAYVREEEGFGLFPNISLRGADTSRSAKVTLMEDGILAAPAPYSAPGAYYSPTTGRMSGIEVLKGSSQIRYGPHITGGAINYLSTPIPVERSGYLRTTYGSFQDIRVHAHHGETFDVGQWGNIGYLVELFYHQTDGFKDIDSAPDFRGDDTGFRNVEPMLKLSWEPDSEAYQRFEFKYGYTDRDADETYLGLSEKDFRDDPYRRYAASRFDQFDSYANRTYLRHYIELDEQLNVNSVIYYNNFHRNWYKLNDLRNIDLDGDGVGDAGANQSLSRALAGGGAGLDVLRGDRAGTLRVRANNRDYYSYGVQVEPTYSFETDWADHEVLFGVRYHADRVRLFQHDDLYVQNASGAIVGRTRNPPGSQENRHEEAEAIALHLQDKISFERLTLTPGVRFEHVWMEAEDSNDPSGAGDGKEQLDLVGGGVGATYELTDQWTALGGVYRGFSPPSPRAAVVTGLDEETSLAFEAGLRYQSPRKSFLAEAIGFYTMFDDLIVIDNIGGAGTGQSMNAGEIDVVGLELLVQYDPGLAYDWGFSMPNFLSFTYTDAELASNDNSRNAESIFAGGRKGNKVPYIPEYLVTVGTGVDFHKFGVFITGSFVDETFSTASNTDRQVDPAGNPDARFGSLDSHFVVDLSGFYRLTDDAKIIAGVHNLFDEEYIASRHPHGPRPGAPQFFYAGLEINF